MIEYSKFRYLYPPRAESALPIELLSQYDNCQYVAQPKLNGDCSVLFSNGIDIIFMDRHKSTFSRDIKIGNELENMCKSICRGKWIVLIRERMSKSKRNVSGQIWNDKFVIFDIIVYEGVQLIGKSLVQRIEILDSILGKYSSHDPWLYSTKWSNIFRVKSFDSNFTQLWNNIINIDMYEGFVLKRKQSKLENGISSKNNISWQLKFRKATKNYLYLSI